MNKGKSDHPNSDSNNELPQTPKNNPTAKMKMTEVTASKDLKSLDEIDEETREIEELKAFLISLSKNKRKVAIKPNIPQTWIRDLKAMLLKLQE